MYITNKYIENKLIQSKVISQLKRYKFLRKKLKLGKTMGP